MKITITGASGFVGTNLQSYLKNKYQIETISVRYVPNQDFTIQTDVIVHLAGKAHDLKNVSIPSDYYEANFELTKQLFDSFLVSSASVFIFLSTVKAVADEVNDVLTEEQICDPKTHYGIAKQKAEQFILSKEIPNKKRVYILRPCMIHGPGNKGNLNLIYKFASKKIPWPLGAFKNQRSYLSIENLCFSIKELIENESVTSGIYHLADDQSLSTNELIELLARSCGNKSVIWNVNPSFVKFIAKLGDYLYLPLNSERLKKLTDNYIVSNKKILKAIEKPLPIKADEGLKKTFKSFGIK